MRLERRIDLGLWIRSLQEDHPWLTGGHPLEEGLVRSGAGPGQDTYVNP
jgi:hypothetical protein